MNSRIASGLSMVALAAVVSLSPIPAGATDSAWTHMIDIFAEACLKDFPDDGAVRQFANDKHFTSLPDEAIHQLLGTDPGQGWTQESDHGRHLLTIEFPPYHTCAVRKIDTSEPDYIAPTRLLIAAWAAKQGATLKESPMQSARMSGLPTEVYSWVVDRGSTRPNETLMIFVTRTERKVAARLVRQIKVEAR